ncbi:nucleotidyltransferase domain-containing protein [Bacillus salacetis]|uniref:nucleotidyltransferase domain-containing protein n=1 Tax=Bacillus salacetis TaxID=2315464 RepID=UPI003B9FAD77
MKDEIRRIAQQFIAAHYPGSDIAWIGGSAVQGNLTKESDIDLVIIDEAETPRLQCYQFHGWKIEAFIYTASSLEFQFQTARYRGIPTIIKMCAEGMLIKDKQGAGKEFQQAAKSLYEQGPERWDEESVKEARYQITDFLSDFRSSEDFAESLFILNKVIDKLAELSLRAEGKWIGEGKWFARNLKAHNKELCENLAGCTKEYMKSEDKTDITSFIESILNQYGGELFAGYKGYLL